MTSISRPGLHSLLLSLIYFCCPISAQLPPTGGASIGAVPFPTMSATDGGGLNAGDVGFQTGAGSSSSTASSSYSSGPDKGAWSLGNGGVIGLSLGIAFVIIAIAVVWTLWYLTKKKQWNIRESFRRASRRFTGRKVPTTTASRPKVANRQGNVMLQPPPPGRKNRTATIDLEKGMIETREDQTRKGASGREGRMPKAGFVVIDEKERSRSSSREGSAGKR